jgi:hypothetical protein
MGVRRINVCIDALLASSAQWHSGCGGQLGTKPKFSVVRTGRRAQALRWLTKPSLLCFGARTDRACHFPHTVKAHFNNPPRPLPPSVYSLTLRRLYSVNIDAAAPPSRDRLRHQRPPAPAASRARRVFGPPKPHSTAPSPPVHTPPPPILIALSARTYHDPADTAPLRRPSTSSSASSASRSRSPGRSTTPSASVPPSDNTSATALATLHATLGYPSKHGILPNSYCLHTPTERSPRPTIPRRDCTVSSMTT